MKNTMVALWRSGKGICIKDLSPTLFLFQIFHEIDIRRVLESGPWTFDQHILLVKRLGELEQPHAVPLYHTSFWIQIYNLLIGFLSEKVLQNIGDYIGEFKASDENNLMGVWRNYMCIRVSIDVRKPLKRRMRLKKSGGDWVWIDFKYERLQVFCFICGLLGHTERQCPSLYDYPEGDIIKPYGQWMKAPIRRNNLNSGERWLRSGPPEMREAKDGNSMEPADVMKVDSFPHTKSGLTISSGQVDGEIEGTTRANKATYDLVPTNSQFKNKGKNIIGAGFAHEEEVGSEMGLIILEAKRRRSDLGLEENLGPQSDTSTIMEGVVTLKNGLVVGPVDQAHRTQ